MIEYYTGREHICTSVTANIATKLFDRNPYRTQLVINATSPLVAGLTNVYLAHTKDDIDNIHPVFLAHVKDATAANGPYEFILILSYPTHGPMVGEEWWCMANHAMQFDATGYLFTD